MTTLGDIYTCIDAIYPFGTQEDWDNSGIQVGYSYQTVAKIALAVDITPAIIEKAREDGVDLIITHHPLYFRGLTALSNNTPQGILTGELVGLGSFSFDINEAGGETIEPTKPISHIAMHTNADKALGGVADIAASVLGLQNAVPLVLSPVSSINTTSGVENTTSTKTDATVGLGRVGDLEKPITLQDLAQLVKSVLPKTQKPVLVAGNPERFVQRIALLPGAGDSEFMAARDAGADVYITSDLRHHPVLDQQTLNYGGRFGDLALIDTPHYAIESLFLTHKSGFLGRFSSKFVELFPELELPEILNYASISTDPWTFSC
ncbi:GTP cyclohydrolase 1 type 2 [Actinomycetota bacterium]|nr:GTP cyclohydrolase 1 type 2 [Actinomycetota bacterium]